MKKITLFLLFCAFLGNANVMGQVILTPISADPQPTQINNGNEFGIYNTNLFSSVNLHLGSNIALSNGCTLQYTATWPNGSTQLKTTTWNSLVGTSGGFIFNVANASFMGGSNVHFSLTFGILSCGSDDAVTNFTFVINPIEEYVLPAELSFFTAKQTDNAVLLEWETTMELNNSFFSVEHGTDRTVYRSIGTINGAGTTDEYQWYQFLHQTPSVGDNYYRLKQVDFDGEFEYSPVVLIQYLSDVSPQYWRVVSASGQVLAEGDITKEIPRDRGLWVFYFLSKKSKKYIQKEMIIRP